MDPTRRDVLVLAAAPLALAACGDPPPADKAPAVATPSRAPDPPAWEAPGTEDPATFPYVAQSGDVARDTAVLMVRTQAPAVTVTLVAWTGDAWAEVASTDATRADGEVSVRVEVAGLTPDTPHAFVFATADGRRTPVSRFWTAPDTARIVTFGATSCLGGNAPWPSVSHVAAEPLDLFCLLGDTVYADDAVTLEDYRAWWDAALAEAGLRDVLTTTSVIATWDDHEVANNWTAAALAPGQYEAALQAFRESLPQSVGPTGAIWRKVSWGPTLDVFVLDCRSERAGDQYISPEQMEWLKDGLSASTARFKIVLNSVPITDYTDMLADLYAEDRWQGYPAQRDEILGYIQDQGIAGVLWVTGDMHHALLAHPDAPGMGPGEDAWEVAVGPAGATRLVVVDLYTDTTGQFVYAAAVWNSTLFVCDPGKGTVRVTFVGDAGEVLFEQELAL